MSIRRFRSFRRTRGARRRGPQMMPFALDSAISFGLGDPGVESLDAVIIPHCWGNESLGSPSDIDRDTYSKCLVVKALHLHWFVGGQMGQIQSAWGTGVVSQGVEVRVAVARVQLDPLSTPMVPMLLPDLWSNDAQRCTDILWRGAGYLNFTEPSGTGLRGLTACGSYSVNGGGGPAVKVAASRRLEVNQALAWVVGMRCPTDFGEHQFALESDIFGSVVCYRKQR